MSFMNSLSRRFSSIQIAQLSPAITEALLNEIEQLDDDEIGT
jgi:hypothetical protein